jgi:flagellar hook-length control protein FliK
MNVTAVGSLLKAAPAAGTKTQSDKGTEFSGIFGKVLKSGQDVPAERKKEKRRAQSDDNGGQTDASGAPVQNDASVQGGSAAAAAQTAAASAVPGDPAGQTVQKQAASEAEVPSLQAVPDSVPEQSAGISAEQFVSNVTAQIRESGRQTKLAAAAAADVPASLPAEGTASAGSQTAAVPAAVQQEAAQLSGQPAAQAPETTSADQTARLAAQPQQPAQAPEASAAAQPAAQPPQQPVQTAGQAQEPSAGQTAQPAMQPQQPAQTAEQAAGQNVRTETRTAPDGTAGGKTDGLVDSVNADSLQDSAAPAAARAANAEDGGRSSDSGLGDPAKSTDAKDLKSRQVEKSEPAPFSAYPQAAASRMEQKAELTELQAAVDRALNRFETDFQDVKTDGSAIHIALEPKELGSISITLAAGLSGVAAKIQTDNKDAASLISNQVQRMVQSMEAKGVRVESVEVTCNQFSQQDPGGGNAGQYQGQPQTQPYVPLVSAAQRDSGSALSNYESVTEQYASQDNSGGRVEYRV